MQYYIVEINPTSQVNVNYMKNYTTQCQMVEGESKDKGFISNKGN